MTIKKSLLKTSIVLSVVAAVAIFATALFFVPVVNAASYEWWGYLIEVEVVDGAIEGTQTVTVYDDAGGSTPSSVSLSCSNSGGTVYTTYVEVADGEYVYCDVPQLKSQVQAIWSGANLTNLGPGDGSTIFFAAATVTADTNDNDWHKIVGGLNGDLVLSLYTSSTAGSDQLRLITEGIGHTTSNTFTHASGDKLSGAVRPSGANRCSSSEGCLTTYRQNMSSIISSHSFAPSTTLVLAPSNWLTTQTVKFAEGLTGDFYNGRVDPVCMTGTGC